jgi:hypothetical protein
MSQDNPKPGKPPYVVGHVILAINGADGYRVGHVVLAIPCLSQPRAGPLLNT